MVTPISVNVTKSIIIVPSPRTYISSVASGYQFPVVLSIFPSQPLTITVTSSSPSVSLTNTSLTFTAANWNVPQYVMVATGAVGSASLTFAPSGTLSTTNPPPPQSLLLYLFCLLFNAELQEPQNLVLLQLC
jgi:hypothetical protein